MIKIEDLVLEFKSSMNEIDRQANISIPLEDVIMYLNKAQISWIKSKIGINNIYRSGYENSRKRIDDLQILKKEGKKLVPIKINGEFPSYYCSLEPIKNDYMFYLKSYGECIKNKNKAKLSINLIKTGELTTKIKNDHFKPSFEWRETIATLGNDNLRVYTDDSFEIQSVYIDYLRYPKNVEIEGYIKLDNNASQNVDCELPGYAKDDIVDLATKFASQALGNQNQAVMAEDRLIKNAE